MDSKRDSIEKFLSNLRLYPMEYDIEELQANIEEVKKLLIHAKKLAELSIANLLGRVPGKIPFVWDDSKDYVYLHLDKDDAQSLIEELTELSEVNLRDAQKYLL